MSHHLDSAAIRRLVAAARELVEEGVLPSAQLALAYDGALVETAAFGRARLGASERALSTSTLHSIYSATKAVVSAAAWLLLQDERLALDERVAAIVPELATQGIGEVRVEHLLTHTAGFPDAPFDPLDWPDRDRRLARFAKWRLQWEPGSRFVYHATSAMWVLAEVIECRAGSDFRSFVHERLLKPFGVEDLHLGLPAALNDRTADVTHVGVRPTAAELAALGLRLTLVGPEYEAYLENYNRPEVRAIGAPGSGGVATAAALAIFYQRLMRRDPVFRPRTIEAALTPRTGDLLDPITGRKAHRGLGVVLAGDDERVFRGFAFSSSPRAFGHPGAGGQVAWADPETGLSFAFLTSGLDRNPIAMGMRGLTLSSLAAACVV